MPIARTLLAAAALLVSPTAVRAADLAVEVTGIRSDGGEVGCALFSGERGFPMDSEAARQDWQPARRGGVTCRFAGLPAGRYAVAVSHDLNGNRRTDTNFVGLPTEDWGVSNGVRPSLRAPRFVEAAFTLPAEGAVSVRVAIAP